MSFKSLASRIESAGLVALATDFHPAPFPEGVSLVEGGRSPFHEEAQKAFHRLAGKEENALPLSPDGFAHALAVIALNPDFSFYFAGATGRRFTPGESAIASNGSTAARYALRVTKARFPQGEFAILANAERADRDAYLAMVAGEGVTLETIEAENAEALTVLRRWDALSWKVKARVRDEGMGFDTLDTLEAETRGQTDADDFFDDAITGGDEDEDAPEPEASVSQPDLFGAAA